MTQLTEGYCAALVAYDPVQTHGATYHLLKPRSTRVGFFIGRAILR
jgi:hypothetical protein